jgi:hypothetical protein
VELSFVLGVLAIVTVVATRLLMGLLSIENRSGREVQEAAILNRLGQQWREDLHRASSVTVSEDAASLQLALGAGTEVEYRIAGDKLTREQREHNRRAPAREAYSVAARKWAFERSDDGRTMSLVRESSPNALIRSGDSAAPSRVDNFEAAIGVLVAPRSATGGALP